MSSPRDDSLRIDTLKDATIRKDECDIPSPGNSYFNQRKAASMNSLRTSLRQSTGSNLSGISISDFSDSELDELGGIFDSVRIHQKHATLRKDECDIPSPGKSNFNQRKAESMNSLRTSLRLSTGSGISGISDVSELDELQGLFD
mmetsp:Transcript_5264/g.6881  ORF Transcript_5264/g.6881 Transcript_5264/m.6881 type:complete len:145 (+) Transcript_5264:203-637(+)